MVEKLVATYCFFSGDCLTAVLYTHNKWNMATHTAYLRRTYKAENIVMQWERGQGNTSANGSVTGKS